MGLSFWLPDTVCDEPSKIEVGNCDINGQWGITLQTTGYSQIDSTCTGNPVLVKGGLLRRYDLLVAVTAEERRKINCAGMLQHETEIGNVRFRDEFKLIPLKQLNIGNREAYGTPVGTAPCQETAFEAWGVLLFDKEYDGQILGKTNNGECLCLLQFTLQEISC